MHCDLIVEELNLTLIQERVAREIVCFDCLFVFMSYDRYTQLNTTMLLNLILYTIHISLLFYSKFTTSTPHLFPFCYFIRNRIELIDR